MRRVFALLALCTLHAPADGAPSQAPESDGERLSLEQLLERCRQRRDARLAELRDEVGALIATIEALAADGDQSALDAYRKRLARLGPESAPLLVPALDPGPGAADGAVIRARLIAGVLREFSTVAISSELLDLLARASQEGRRNVLAVLGRSEDPERVSPFLRDYYRRLKGSSMRPATLAALAELGGAENERFLGELLSEDDPQAVEFALHALASAQNASAAPQVLALLGDRSSAAAHVGAILAYYGAVPAAVDGDTSRALLDLARTPRTDADDAVRLLETLADFEKAWPLGFERDLKKLADTADRKVAEGALVALVRTGNRAAKRELLRPYDERIDEQRDWAQAFEERGDVNYRIQDFKKAIKDYEEALKANRGSARGQADVYLQIARCYARMGKLNDARKWLNDAPITLSQLRALAEDPVFAELAEHPRYRDVFRID